MTGVRVFATVPVPPVSFDAMVEAAVRAHVVFFGEQHDDPETHRVELDLLDAIGRRKTRVILSLEMFERDVQPLLDDYLGGRITEGDFLAKSRPWDRYSTDYRGMVQLAKSKGWPVIASNVPRTIASAIGRKGLAALDSLSRTERAWAARDISCPDDDYRKRFLVEMKGHSAGAAAPAAADTLPTAVAQRFYVAQCVKDETMAESIAEALRGAEKGTIVVHYDGAFHSDYRQGAVERFRRRASDAKTLVIVAVPVVDPSSATPLADGRADYVIFTRAKP